MKDDSMLTAPAPSPQRIEGLHALEVLRATTIAPWLRRVTFGGPNIRNMRVDPSFIGPHVKVLLPPLSGEPPEWPMRAAGRIVWPEERRRPVMRTYSVRAFNAQAGELDVDFVLHGDEGVASAWAARAKPGDVAGIWPGGRAAVGAPDYYLFAGDETAIPAIAYSLETLPADARGHVVIEVEDDAHELEMPGRAAFDVIWLRRRGGPSRLVEAVARLPAPACANPFVWGGAEASIARRMRAWAKTLPGLNKQNIYVLNYWKIGVSEGGFERISDAA